VEVEELGEMRPSVGGGGAEGGDVVVGMLVVRFGRVVEGLKALS
jgi:hypothetical protein